MSERFPEGPLTILFSDVEGSTDLRMAMPKHTAMAQSLAARS